MVETFDPNAIDYTGVEPGEDLEYRAFKPGIYDLEIKTVDFAVDDKKRQNLRVRFDLLDGQPAEIIPQEGDEFIDSAILKTGGVFERFWFHTPKALPIFARFLTKLGLKWEDYLASTDKKRFVETVVGMKIKAAVEYDSEFKKNQIGKILQVIG